jgi:formylglycine-generating enzyme required for sulfatase activity
LRNFAIGKNEVTFAEYRVFAHATGRKMPSDEGWGEGRRPVINISWTDAADYARWLTGQTGVNYRLPTEAEWEYAASGGVDSFYWWGYELGENRASCFDCGSRWDAKSTAPVGSFPANPFSLYDTAGNVMEWVADCYHTSYRGAPKDGSAWVEKNCVEYVARGGAYNKPGDSLHTVRRFNFQQDTRLPILGFRVARDVD